jgi:hypothetical protein
MSSKRKRQLAITGGVIAGYAVATVIAQRRGYKFGRSVPVRCRDGHLFSTVWIPGASFKSLRFGLWRVQWCPVGRHVTLVTLVKESDLTPAERRLAAAHHDLPVP